MLNDLTVFAVFESRNAWEQQHSELAKCGYGRFLEDDESIAKIVDEIRLAGVSVEAWPYSTIKFGALLEDLKCTAGPILWNLTDGYEFYLGSNFPAFVQLAGIPHIGSGSYTQMLCQNKHHLKAVAHSLGIQIACGVNFNIHSKRPFIIPQELTPPYFVKPTRLDNGIGDKLMTPIFSDAVTALAGVDRLLQMGITDVLVEEFLQGDEFTVVAVNDGSWIMECAHVSYGGEKYFSSTIKDNDSCRSEIVKGTRENEMITQCMELAQAVKLQDYFRADFRCDSTGRPKLLEVNSNPFLVSKTFDEFAKLHFRTRPEMFKKMIMQSYLRQQNSIK